MQKLLRRSPTGPLLCSAASKPPSSSSSNCAMPPAMSTLRGGGSSLAAASSSPSLSTKLNSPTMSRKGVRHCSMPTNNPQRKAWTALKQENSRDRVAWLGTCSDGFSSLAAAAASDSSFTNESSGGNAVSSEGKPAFRAHARRSRDSSSSLLAGNPDLLEVPGIGARNLRKFVEKGIAGVAQLKQLYRDKFFGKSNEKMVHYLKSSVGIIHKNHAESITTYIKESVEEELKDSDPEVKSAPRKRLTFCVEGNISVGKTTFLQRIANETVELRDLVEVVPEPVGKWQDIGPDHFNILDAFYAEPQRYAYTFQNYVFVTRVMQERESSGGLKPLRLMERSIFSDRMVFVRAVHEAKWMNEMEISIYDSWFDPVVSVLPGLIPDGFIYLRASPDTCHQRMKVRRRAEEGGVSLGYLRDLHEKHENWLFPFESGNHGVLGVSKPPLLNADCLPPDISDRVFYLQGDHMHSSIQKVPALVLDCEPNIDFSRDIDAKRQYASQVAQFFEFVKKRKAEEPPSSPTSGGNQSQQKVLLSPNGGLWTLDGKPFPGSAFGSLDLGKLSLMGG